MADKQRVDRPVDNLLKDSLFRMDHVSFHHFHSAVILYQALRKEMIDWFKQNPDLVMSMVPEKVKRIPGEHIVSELDAFSLYTVNMTNSWHINMLATRLAVVQELLGFALELKIKQLICLEKKQIRNRWPKDGHKLLPLFNLLSQSKQLKLRKLYRDCKVCPLIFDLKIGKSFSGPREDDDVDVSKLPLMLKMIDKYKMGYEKRFSEFDNAGETSYWFSKEMFIFLSKLYSQANVPGVPGIDYRFIIPDVSNTKDLSFVLNISHKEK